MTTEAPETVEEVAPVPHVPPPGPVTTVAALRPGTGGHDLTLKVVSSKTVRSAKGGSRMSEALVGDSTGVVIMTSRLGQVDLVQPGNTIVVKGGYIDMYKAS